MGYFENVKKNFGFGCMRLPMKGSEVDYDEFCRMIDLFMAEGFNYFDTAKVYLEGKSETALRDCLVARYPRESYVFTNKLSTNCFGSEAEVRPLLEKQLRDCGLGYFDFYLMHAQNKEVFEKYKKCRAYEQAIEFRKEGKIKHLGMSFHDRAELLDEILTEYPAVEAVQIQLNYVDLEDPAIQSRKCYDVCRKHGKPMIIMEPVKGGALANLPPDAAKILDNLHGGSAASYAVRFAAGFDGVFMVLSGMSNLEQMKDNLSHMKDFKPLDEKERAAVDEVCAVFRSKNLIPCTACRYCIDGCPKHIDIPNLFSCMNAKRVYDSWNANYYYHKVYTGRNGKASDCIKCGKCEHSCPQHLPIRKLLEDVAAEFEKADNE